MSQRQWKTQGHSVLGHNRATARMNSQQLRCMSKTLTSSSQTKSQHGERKWAWNPTLYKELLATGSCQERENPFSLRARLLLDQPCSRGRLQFKRIQAALAVLHVLKNKQTKKSKTDTKIGWVEAKVDLRGVGEGGYDQSTSHVWHSQRADKEWEKRKELIRKKGKKEGWGNEMLKCLNFLGIITTWRAVCSFLLSRKTHSPYAWEPKRRSWCTHRTHRETEPRLPLIPNPPASTSQMRDYRYTWPHPAQFLSSLCCSCLLLVCLLLLFGGFCDIILTL